MSELLVAGTVPLTPVMAALARQRPVFHSEADFQFAFAWVVATLDPSVGVRLEVRQPGDVRESVDLVCRGTRTTFIEFKYFTARWIGADPLTGEDFYLREHAAADEVRLNFIHDVRRLERFTEAGRADDGLAIMLTNYGGLWRPGRRITADEAFRIHEGAELSGTRAWGGDPDSTYTHNLRGSYVAAWRDYAPALPGANGALRWLAWEVRKA